MYSLGTTNSTTQELSSARYHLSAGMHRQCHIRIHARLAPPATNYDHVCLTYGLRHLSKCSTRPRPLGLLRFNSLGSAKFQQQQDVDLITTLSPSPTPILSRRAIRCRVLRVGLFWNLRCSKSSHCAKTATLSPLLGPAMRAKRSRVSVARSQASDEGSAEEGERRRSMRPCRFPQAGKRKMRLRRKTERRAEGGCLSALPLGSAYDSTRGKPR